MQDHFLSILRHCETAISRDLIYDDIAPRLIQGRLVTIDEHMTIVDLPTESKKTNQLINILGSKNDRAFTAFINVLLKDYDWLARALLSVNISVDETDYVRSQPTGDIAPTMSVNNNKYDSEKENDIPEGRLQNNSRKRNSDGEFVNSEVNAVVNNSTNNGTQNNCDKQSEVPCSSITNNNQSSTNKDSGITREMMKIVQRNYRVSRGWTSLAHSLGLTSLIHEIRVKVNTYDESADVCVMYLLQEWQGLHPKDATLLNLINVLRGDGFNDVADELQEKYVTSN